MLYIISFQSISCSEASPTFPRPLKGPPEGSSARAEGAGLHPVHTPLLRKEFSTVLRAVPRVGSLSGLWAGSDRSSGRAVSSVIPSIFHPVSLTLLSSVIWPVFPSIFRPVSLTLLSSVLWPVPQNNSQAGPRGGLRHGHPIHKYLSAIPAWQSRHLSSLRHGHPAYRYSSAIPTCRDVPKPVSERCSERFLRRSSDRLPVRARLSGGRGEKEISK